MDAFFKIDRLYRNLYIDIGVNRNRITSENKIIENQKIL